MLKLTKVNILNIINHKERIRPISFPVSFGNNSKNYIKKSFNIKIKFMLIAVFNLTI